MKHSQFSPKELHLIQSDKDLGKFVKKTKLKPIPKSPYTPYTYLVRAIIAQQISTAAARSITNKFFTLFEDQKIDFKIIEKSSHEKLRTVGISNQKATYIKDLAGRFNSNLLPPESEISSLSNQEILDSLIQIKGVGEWTIQMMLLFYLKRPDIWPVKDLGVKKGFQVLHNLRKLPDEKYLLKFGEKYSPHRSLAARYYWHALDFT